MNEIILDIQDTQGRLTTLAVYPESPLSDVVEVAQEALGLPLHDEQGRLIPYALYHYREARFLGLDISLRGLKLVSQDRLRIVKRPIHDLFELELQSVPNPGMLFPMTPHETTIGRDFSNKIVIRHKSVSRGHGIFEWQDGFHVYMDLGSANGSWINNAPVTHPLPITDGDVLSLGQTVNLIYRERDPKDMTDYAPRNSQTNTDMQSRTELASIPKAEIYLSFSEGQYELAEMLYENMSIIGSKVWFKPDDTVGAMQRSDVMVAILSRESVKHEATLEQWRYYSDLRKPIVLVLVEPCRLPMFIDDEHLIEYHYDDAKLNHDILQKIRRLIG